MIVYSKKIIQFLCEIKSITKKIISQEIGLKVVGDRFYDKFEEFSYPIKIVIYSNKSMLGYFDANFYELGFHECLMQSHKDNLIHVIRHELAHYMNFISFGETIQPHGVEFKAFCEKMKWPNEVSRATICLEEKEGLANVEESSICRKIRKLMALSSSSNAHEAEQAIIKSQQLLLKHNIDSKYMNFDDEEKIFLKRIMKQKKVNAKMRSIANILETFFVSIIYKQVKGAVYLEILGSVVNIEIAEYVASVLELELDTLWNQAKKDAHLKGLIAKNSFFLGLAKGYCNKIQSLKKGYAIDTTQALVVIEKKLLDAKMLVYSRLSSIKSHANHCQKSSALGEKAGAQLMIHRAINRTSPSREPVYISYSGER